MGKACASMRSGTWVIQYGGSSWNRLRKWAEPVMKGFAQVLWSWDIFLQRAGYFQGFHIKEWHDQICALEIQLLLYTKPKCTMLLLDPGPFLSHLPGIPLSDLQPLTWCPTSNQLLQCFNKLTTHLFHMHCTVYSHGEN